MNKTICRSFSSSLKPRHLAVCALRSDLISVTHHRGGFHRAGLQQLSLPPLCSLCSSRALQTQAQNRESQESSRDSCRAHLHCCYNADTRCSFSTLYNLLQFSGAWKVGVTTNAFQSHLWEENTEAAALIYSCFESVLKVSLSKTPTISYLRDGSQLLRYQDDLKDYKMQSLQTRTLFRTAKPGSQFGQK